MSIKNKGLQFVADFYQKTAETPNVWDSIEWEIRDALISTTAGGTIFEMKEIEIPKSWSQLATDIVASKYFRKAGVPNERGHEYSVKELVHRVVHTIAQKGDKDGYFTSPDDCGNFENDLKWLLLHQYGAFNSPVWFNVGLYHEYKISGDGENYAWTGEGEGTKNYRIITNQYERPQGSACFIQGVDDSLSSIFELVKNEARLFKYGSGTGSNMSCLRGANERLSGGGKSSGLLSFLKVLDSAAGAIKSGGTTRRAAVMRCLDIDHPEILDFINWKSREEAKAKALIAQGYSADFNGEAYATVAGQNSNNSVRLSNEFMQQLEQDGNYSTINRTDNSIYETYKAKELFNKICEAAWNCADPGLQFDGIINDWHTCSNSAPIRSSNPCSEYMFIDDSACNLASLNLLKFYVDGKFQTEKFKKACRIFLLAQEILVDLGSYPTAKIAQTSHEFRPLGLGYANLGTLLMMAGYPYDSDNGRKMAGLVTAVMTGCSYNVSAEIARAKTPFLKYQENSEVMLKVIKRHKEFLSQTQYKSDDPGLMDLKKTAEKCWQSALENGTKYGFRNAQVSVLAPTGTIGLLMDCATTGVEPAFSLVMWKKLAGGGIIPIVNQSVPDVLKKLGYSDKVIKEIVEYVEKNSTIEGAPSLQEAHLPIFDCAMSGGTGIRFISPMGHIKMMGSIQPFLSGAISKTVNLPADSTVQDIEDVYLKSWELGLKAIAIYRDGSKGSQPLNTTNSEDEKTEYLETITFLKDEIDKLKKNIEQSTPKPSPDWGIAKGLPDIRTGRTWEIKVAGTKVFLRSGENVDGTLGEIFIDLGYKEGSTVRALMNQFAISISFSLQHGVPLEKLVDKFSFTKFEPHGRVEGHPYLKSATSLIDAIFRVLGHHYLGRIDFLQIKPTPTKTDNESLTIIKESKENKKAAQYDEPETTHDHMPCADCGGTEFLRTGTCYVCITCGSSQGCS